MKTFAIWKQGEVTAWYSPEPDTVSSAGAGRARKEVKQIEEMGSSEDAIEIFRGSSQEWERGMVSQGVRKAASRNPSQVGKYMMYSSKLTSPNSCV